MTRNTASTTLGLTPGHSFRATMRPEPVVATVVADPTLCYFL